MTVVRLRRLLIAFVTLCGLSVVIVLLWAFAWPIGFSAPDASALELPTPSAPGSVPTTESLVQQFLPHWKKRLRQPLQDPPPVEPKESKPTAAAAKSVPLPNVELLGTITDGMQTWAMLQTGPNQMELCKPGDSIQVGNFSLKVIGVETDQVVLRHQEKEIRVALKQPARAL